MAKTRQNAKKGAKTTKSAQVTTQEVEEKVPQTAKEETVETPQVVETTEQVAETPQVVETLESKALKIKKDWNAEKIFYCNGKFYATEAEAIKAGSKGFAYYIF